MLRIILLFLAIVALGLLIGYTAAEENEMLKTAESFTIDNAAWLTGYWRGEGFGGVIEEYWGTPSAGTMIGMFRLVENGQPVFFEFWSLHKVDDATILQLKHFGADMVGWEDKDRTADFHLLQYAENQLLFSGLEYRLKEPGLLEIILTMKHSDGSISKEILMLNKIAGFDKD